jgi:Domain of unknown function (DUF6259)
MDNLETQFGDLILAGAPGLGRLQSLTNKATGFAVGLDPTKGCWSVEVEADGKIFNFGAEHCRAETVSNTDGVFVHEASGACVTLAWQSLHHDAVTARLSVSMDRNGCGNGRVIGITFQLPGRAVVASADECDTLYYPYCAGIRIKDPAQELFRKAETRVANWLDRTLTARARGFDLEERHNEVEFRNDYSGRCGMAWLDYAGPSGGLYLACHDPDVEHGLLTVAAQRGEPGLAMWIGKRFNRPLATVSADFVVALHDGDWRRGADIYREWFTSAFPPIRRADKTLRRGPGIMCHYDFKWQNGVVGKRFADIPALMADALENGFDSILCAGWNIGGFDNHYPEFRPDPDLGTEAELQDAVAHAQEMGGRVFFYVNAFSFDTAHPDYPSQGRPSAIEDATGQPLVAQWGSRKLAGMCNSVEEWRRRVMENARYVIRTLGANGVYLDQLAVRPQACHNPGHAHTTPWIANSLSLVDAIRADLADAGHSDAILFSEFITDALATRLDFQLCHTCWMAGIDYAFPEMFRYTFPEATLADQVFQKPWPGDPVEVEEDHVREILCREFVTGLKMWVYDHTLANPREVDFFRRVVRLRERGADYFADGVFIGAPQMSNVPSTGVEVGAWLLEGRGLMLAVWNRTGEPAEFTLAPPIDGALTLCDLDGGEWQRPGPIGTIVVPATPLSLCLIETGQ